LTLSTSSGDSRRLGDADRCADEELLALDVEGSAHLGDDPAGHHLGLQPAPVVLQQHGELVAAEPRHGVRRADARRQARGDGAQELVAGGVADAVVDRLEPVEVDEAHAQIGLATGRHVERVLQAVQEERAVG
jgi:hypothetical protein